MYIKTQKSPREADKSSGGYLRDDVGMEVNLGIVA
jgi:hypothetical protein